jgi:hypothetical protein
MTTYSITELVKHGAATDDVDTPVVARMSGRFPTLSGIHIICAQHTLRPFGLCCPAAEQSHAGFKCTDTKFPGASLECMCLSSCVWA